MPVNAEQVTFKHAVVAASDDQGGTVTMNSVDLGPSFTFESKCMLPATVLFNLSIPLPQGVILYLQFIPSVICCLEKKPCNYNDAKRPPYFDALQRHWRPHRAFTRLRFELCGHGRLIKPTEFNPDRCDNENIPTLLSGLKKSIGPNGSSKSV